MLDADTSYTLALAAQARSALTARTAADADTLLRMAIARRDAGDAADAYPVDSLTEPPAADSLAGEPLSVAAAMAGLRAATLNLTAEQRSRWASPSLIAGIETHDPRGDEPGILPVFGVALPLPLFDWNRGAIAAASAGRRRAVAELELARLESRTQIAQARRERSAALARIARGRTLVESANRVAAMSLVAYREGAATLPNVLEAQRNARDILAQYVDDLARAWIAGATLRALTLTSAPVP
jgi:cobalt-zinc-cadmium efflux system outer membrane protein